MWDASWPDKRNLTTEPLENILCKFRPYTLISQIKKKLQLLYFIHWKTQHISEKQKKFYSIVRSIIYVEIWQIDNILIICIVIPKVIEAHNNLVWELAGYLNRNNAANDVWKCFKWTNVTYKVTTFAGYLFKCGKMYKVESIHWIGKWCTFLYCCSSLKKDHILCLASH